MAQCLDAPMTVDVYIDIVLCCLPLLSLLACPCSRHAHKAEPSVQHWILSDLIIMVFGIAAKSCDLTSFTSSPTLAIPPNTLLTVRPIACNKCRAWCVDECS